MPKPRSFFEEIKEVNRLLIKRLSRFIFNIPSPQIKVMAITFIILSGLSFAISIYDIVKDISYISTPVIPLSFAVAFALYGLFFLMTAMLKKRREEAEKSISKIKYSDLGDAEHKEYLLKLKDKYEFEKNLKETIILKSLKIEGLDFFSDFIWEFNPSINVLLGKNGYGKSYLLRLLATMLYKEKKSRNFFKDSKSESIVNITLSRGEKWEQISRDSKSFFEAVGKVPILAIPDMRYVNQSKDTIDIADTDSLTEDDSGDLSSNGATYFIHQQPYEAVIQTFLYQLFIVFLDHIKSFDRQIFRLIKRVVEKLTVGKFSFEKITPVGSARFKMEVLTEADDNRPIPIQKASQGTLSVLAIFGLIHNYLRSVFPDVNDKELLNQHGIIIIDEIDAHLHPNWQQKIIGLLRKNYPNVQFILTAHNPLVIAGCYENEVNVLRKKDEGFFVEPHGRDLIGARSEDIYKELFEVEDIDETFLHYATQLTLNKDHSERIKKLESKKVLSEDEDRELVNLNKETKRLEKVSKLQEERSNKLYDLELETLRARIRELEYLLERRDEGK